MTPKSKDAKTKASKRSLSGSTERGSKPFPKRKPLGPKATLAETRKSVQEAEEELTHQFYQDKSITDLAGFGCGSYTFGTADKIPFKSPYNGDMRIEIVLSYRPGHT